MTEEFIWGVAAIGRVIGRTRAQTYHLLYARKLTSPRKIGDQWMVSRSALMRELGADQYSQEEPRPA